MIAMLAAAMVAFAITIVVTPVAVRFFHARSIGHRGDHDRDGEGHHGGGQHGDHACASSRATSRSSKGTV